MLTLYRPGFSTSNTSESWIGAYFQDDFKITPRLTVNLGIRYELFFPYVETQDHMANMVIDPASPNFGQLVLAGRNGQSRSLLQMDKNNWAPRVGFAWRVPGVPDKQRPEDAADKEQPADKDPHRQCSDVWLGNRQKAEHHHQDALREKQLPVGVDRQRQLAPDTFEVCHVAHVRTRGECPCGLDYNGGVPPAAIAGFIGLWRLSASPGGSQTRPS